jgi:hypothetical protein
MTDGSQSYPPLRHFFAGLIEHVFYSDMGMGDPNLIDYLSDLLMGFLHTDRIYCLKDRKGRRLREVAEMVARAEMGPKIDQVERDRIVHRHVGDFTLFWTGVYPEVLRARQATGDADRMTDFLSQGKRSYAITSELTPDYDMPSPSVYRRLSENFEFCVYGLGEVRKGWEGQDGDHLGLDHFSNS